MQLWSIGKLMLGVIKMKAEKTINITMPSHLHDFVKSQANELGIPTSTMYVMIVNDYKK